MRTVVYLASQQPTKGDAAMRSPREIVTIVLAVCMSVLVSSEQSHEQLALMTKGKLEADLGNHAKAADAFAAVANDGSVPDALRWQALVRLGLARAGAGDTSASLDTFKSVFSRYSSDRNARRFATGALASGVPGKIWPEFRPQLEEVLRTANVISVTYAGMPKSSARIVRLEWDEFELRAAWKSGGDRERGKGLRSDLAELAAYEIDKLMGLDMVPPTVPRLVEGQQGAITFWVNGVRVYRDAQEIPNTPQWSRQISRMKLYDSLIGNNGRNLANMIVDQNDNLLLIDHTRAFSSDRTLKDPPSQFDRRLVEKLKALDTPQSRRHLKSVLGDDEIASLMARRDGLVAHLQKLIIERGESAVMFEPRW
jgi:hypothetical protein